MRLRALLFFLVGSRVASMTVFPNILSESEAAIYREQAARALASSPKESLQIDTNVAARIRRVLVGQALLDEHVEKSVWNVPISVDRRNPLKSGVKGTSNTFQGDRVAYIVLEESGTDLVNPGIGSLVVFEADEDPRLFFKGETRALGPLRVVKENKERRTRKKGKNGKSGKKGKKGGKSSDSSSSDEGDGEQENNASLSTTAPTFTPTDTPTYVPTFVPTSPPTGAPVAATTIRTRSPTSFPTSLPTATPTSFPTSTPTATPTLSPVAATTIRDDPLPTISPASSPTSAPTLAPVASPTSVPTSVPTASPTNEPTSGPTASPETDTTSSGSTPLHSGPCVCNYIPQLQCVKCHGRGGSQCGNMGTCGTPALEAETVDVAEEPCVCNYMPAFRCTQCQGGGDECEGDCDIP